MKTRRIFSFEEKVMVLKDAEILGVTQALRKHSISIGTYYNWKRKVELHGEQSLQSSHQRIEPQLKKLQQENLRLKQLLADKELALMIQQELLKKTIRTEKKS
jgi:putative transposase